MKRTAIMLSLLTAFLMSTAVPMSAADMAMGGGSKDECVLAAKNCKTEVDSLQQRIERLNTEIAKGTKVYSATELKKLKDKLAEANALLDSIAKE